ncbi:MAG: lytic transglycosylase domain-containing protein [Pseudomonadota bacterium]
MLNASRLLKLCAGAGLLGAMAFTYQPVSKALAQSYGSVGSLAGHQRGPAKPDQSPASKTLKAGLDALDKDRMSVALAARSKLPGGSLERKVMAWAIAMNGEDVDALTLSKIANDLAYWPGQKRMRANMERALVNQSTPAALRVAFSQSAPETDAGRLALARAHKQAGNKKAARRAIAPLWRANVLTRKEESTILREFGAILSKADHQARVEYLLGKRRLRGAQRIAGKAGARRLVAARVAVERKQRDAAKRLSAVPGSQKRDPNYLISRAKYLRQQGKLQAAAKTLLSVKSNKILDETRRAYAIEQRILASDLLEAKAVRTAYKLAANNVAKRESRRIDGEFYAGWIALRKVKDAKTAQRHFARLLKMATRPLSLSRGHYWMGRALAAQRKTSAAKASFEKAARFDTTYYGQLAGQRLGKRAISVSKAKPSGAERTNFNRYELVQAIAKLESAGHPRKARTIYRYLSRHLDGAGELALLSARAERRGDYQLALQVGKVGFIRGKAVDNLAWPLGAIPRNTKVGGAGLALAYAIARQESTFQVDARSSANALGLLQLLPSTAKRTARSIGISYSKSRLTRDAAYNARLGTAFLSQQLQRFNGSYVLTFAAYNAGPRRAVEWINRFGDPRGKPIEQVVDWVESIPFSETRNYVQRVMENYQVYKRRLQGSKLTIERDLRRGRPV